jgi:hypothetical protein
VLTIKHHAKRIATLGRIDELLCGATANIAAEDVTGEQLSCVERRAAALGDAFRGVGAGQNDNAILLLRRYRGNGGSRAGRNGSQDH